ncbi:hypothetical protein QFZ79_003908 [Arthrobacter sp. V4I6]|uniref:hypothetical protein n=1 Tax=unclassified Arthrobacter TaxID=235627 RepID=UPI002785D6F9|nr:MULTISPECIES: hypothetical protein [unclassified Arthrobacter]MDQ0821532.1 hypothetical protein [Arthrobacter sp. V1I7]MDQ0855797.1 hypothetical protein [Arthrobacter sp. V4I6]
MPILSESLYSHPDPDQCASRRFQDKSAFLDPFLQTLTNSQGVLLTFAGLPAEPVGIHFGLLCVRFRPRRLRFTLPCVEFICLRLLAHLDRRCRSAFSLRLRLRLRPRKTAKPLRVVSSWRSAADLVHPFAQGGLNQTLMVIPNEIDMDTTAGLFAVYTSTLGRWPAEPRGAIIAALTGVLAERGITISDGLLVGNETLAQYDGSQNSAAIPLTATQTSAINAEFIYRGSSIEETYRARGPPRQKKQPKVPPSRTKWRRSELCPPTRRSTRPESSGQACWTP